VIPPSARGRAAPGDNAHVVNALDSIPPTAEASAPTLPWRPASFLQALGPAYGTALSAQPLPAPRWVARSDALAAQMGLTDWVTGDEALQVLSGNGALRGAAPFASVYSGHQFGVWAGQLGDGRALLLGELDTPAGPVEVQLKGSGLTPYSRMGDGRAVLRSSIREFLCSEAMHALGIPTTRALAVTASPQPVRRETMETAAVVTRVAPSFLRFGHFEHFAHTVQDSAALRTPFRRQHAALLSRPVTGPGWHCWKKWPGAPRAWSRNGSSWVSAMA
jgi:uncharacterized protein YdiU (UPF0061 family)